MTVVALVPARNEGDRIGDTVRALRSLAGIDEVIVVDGGSQDHTVRAAVREGARVLVAPFVMGKGDALEAALWRRSPSDVSLFVDGDLGGSASGVEPLLQEIERGRADMAIGVLPAPPSGGFGLVKNAAGAAIRRVTGFEARAPLSGQRAITAECLGACRPLAPGFGLEVGLTMDAVRMGFRIVEVPIEVEHRWGRRDAAGFRHRARQGVDALRATAPRALSLR